MIPNTNSHLSTVEPVTFMSDVDIDEMFLKFFLDRYLRKYNMVDLVSYFGDNMVKGKETFWVRWDRIAPPCIAQFRSWPGWMKPSSGTIWIRTLCSDGTSWN
jgi:hypothetical protein